MTPQLEGTLETLQMDLAGRQLRLVLERRGPQGARFASVAFVSGGLDPADDRAWWLQQARLLQCPLQVVLAAEAPPRSKTEMEALGWEAADQLSVIPGRLGLHQEFGALLARQLLESDGSFG